MYAIVETGGKQYKLEEGRYVDIELLDCGLKSILSEENSRVKWKLLFSRLLVSGSQYFIICNSLFSIVHLPITSV